MDGEMWRLVFFPAILGDRIQEETSLQGALATSSMSLEVHECDTTQWPTVMSHTPFVGN